MYSVVFDHTLEVRYISVSGSEVLSNCEALRRSSAIAGDSPMHKLHRTDNGAWRKHLFQGVNVSLEVTR